MSLLSRFSNQGNASQTAFLQRCPEDHPVHSRETVVGKENRISSLLPQNKGLPHRHDEWSSFCLFIIQIDGIICCSPAISFPIN